MTNVSISILLWVHARPTLREKHSDSNKNYSESDIFKMLDFFFIYKIFVVFGNHGPKKNQSVFIVCLKLYINVFILIALNKI